MRLSRCRSRQRRNFCLVARQHRQPRPRPYTRCLAVFFHEPRCPTRRSTGLPASCACRFPPPSAPAAGYLYVRRQTNQRRNCDKSLAHTHRIPRHLAGDRRHDILCCHLLGWPARRRPTSMDRASSPHSRLVGGDSLSHPRCPQSLATNWQGQIDVFWQLRRQLQLHCRHWRQHEHWHFWHLPPNNSFKPNLLRSTKAMAERACHGFGSTTQVGLTQALGVTTKRLSALPNR